MRNGKNQYPPFIVDSTLTITRIYGTSGTGQMRLISESLGSWTKNYEYDPYGRVTSETMTNGSDITKTKTYQYDSSNGLLSRKTLPGGLTTIYTYDSYGNLTGVDGASGSIKWSLSDYTGRSTETRTILDNRTSSPFTRITQLDQHGYLEYIKTHQNGYYYQTDEYGFSAQTGNLMANKQKGMNHYMLFHYDDNDRLSWIEENTQNIMSMSYTPNGNMTYKSDMGSYTYSSTSKPHAVQSVQNSRDKINYNDQYIEYNPWNKVDNIWQTDNTDFYYYFAQYGPDFQKVYSTMDRTYHREYDKFFWGDYEEYLYKNYNNSDVTVWSYWIEAPDGLAGFYWNSSDEYYLAIHPCVAITDHLGSLTGLYDHNGYKTLDATYDAWGKRTFAAGSMQLDRGFTGHEHLDALGLINMNGRMYDPLQGRFLSPDNYIQAPDNPQNYNRYSYCLNNPLKYTDPDGESILAAMAMALFAGGMTNVFIQANNNNIDNFGDAMNALVGGMAAVVSEATSWALGFAALSTGSPLGVLYGHAVNFAKSVNLTTTFVSSIMHPLNASKIVLGRYYTDENGDAWDQMVQGLSRFTWEGPQTWAGYNWSQMRSIAGKVDEVDYLGGATFCINEKGSFGSVSLGNYINADIRGDYQGSITKHPVLMHEYGHTFDSRKMGPMYLFTIGIPSAKSANNSVKINNRYTHSWYWSELRANRAAKKYFGKHYGIDWSIYENFVESEYYYPVERPVPQLLQKDYLEWYYSNY